MDEKNTGLLNDILGVLEEQSDGDTVIETGVGQDDILEVEDFDFDGFQVVRREFFAHTKEPSLTFNDCKIYVNAACLNRLSHVRFVQVLINRNTQVLAIRPCNESDRDSFQWCSGGDGGKKIKPKQVSCKIFFAKLFAMMDWDIDNRYKLLGKIIHSNDEYLIVFDLKSTEVYKRITAEGQKPKKTRIPVFPTCDTNQFGMDYNDHKRSTQVNIFDGYAVYQIREENKDGSDTPPAGGETVNA